MAVADFCCGAECSINFSGSTPSPDARHLLLIGTAPTVQSGIARNGGLAFRFAPVAQAGNSLRRTAPAGGATRWARFYVYFVTLPGIDTTIMRFEVSSGAVPSLVYRTSDTTIRPSISGGTGGTATVVTTGVWYRVDIKADVSTGTATVSLQLDGVDKGTNSFTQAATTFINTKFGPSCTGAVVTADMVYDDFITGTNLADYPAGAGSIVGMSPTSDGAHSFATAGLFIYEAAGANIDPSATDTFSHINHSLVNSIGSFLNAANPAAGDYLEWGFGTLPPLATINGVEVVSSHHAFSGTANKQSMHLMDGITEAVVFDDADFSNTTITHTSKQFALAPSDSLPWLKADVEAMRIRWGSSWTTPGANPDPYIDGLMLEVDFVPAVNSTGSGSPVAPRLSAFTTSAATNVEHVTGSGSPVKARLSAFTTSTASQRFEGSGAAVAPRLSAFASGAGGARIAGTGSPFKTLSAFASGTATNVGHITGTGSPVATLRAFTGSQSQQGVGGMILIAEIDDRPRPKRKKPKPRPETPESTPLAELDSVPEFAPSQLDPALWDRVLRKVPYKERIPPKKAAAPESTQTVEDKLLQHFLDTMGGPVDFNENDVPFMLQRFLRQGR